ncbi:DivIVA family protein [Fictibacillus macauensis ZFHKF-1]|uniref:DivIVA family protein n=1 Tax=Fictibacillus macauensis ZFHKF-1 TaxID=1196324 RepID=I8UIU2_9BACL|nr:DUF2203 domain-containing protein [Fictibacillus macauensis]EIT86810.1 DivIVA family protein [Fictibacillus macauensis ZFHKF-1]
MKYFTVEEANQLIPVISKELEELQALQRSFAQFYDELERVKKSDNPPDDHFFQLESNLDLMEHEAQARIQAIHSLGVELKDIYDGLVDFPAIIDDEEVLLTWRQGEPTVVYYYPSHEYEAKSRALWN